MKKIIRLLIVFTIVSCVIPSAVFAADTARKAKKAYAKLLNTTDALPDLDDVQAGSFSLEDVNGDGIPELCAFRGKEGNNAKCVFTYYDGEVHKLINGSKYVGFFGVPKNELFIYVWKRSGRGEKSVMYTFEDGALEEEVLRDYDKVKNSVTCYDLADGDKEEISEEIFNEIYDELKDGEEPVQLFKKYYENTRENRKSILGYTGVSSSEPAEPGETKKQETGPEYDLSNFGYRTVIISGSSGSLVFQEAPDGAFMNKYQYNTGDSIYVNLTYRKNGYALAYQDGVYGYVVARYIDWDSADGSDGRFDLSDYGYRTVVTNGKGALVFQSAPNGSFMNNYQYNDGDSIYVNLNWRQAGYAIAYSGGVYGYVDAGYINWNTKKDSRYDLSNYGYRTVSTSGRGSLVFQSSPDGSFMYDHEFWDGDSIYVNIYWRQDGYAIAYQNGEYGYVDASYINWNGGGGSSSSGKKDLSNYGYRTVNTGGRGALVFQSSPNGSFMNSYQYNTGDSIYVNLTWRKDGYAIAYSGGVYGYVDASYIEW